MSSKRIRLITRHFLKFIAGFASLTQFASIKLKSQPFADPKFALDKDWLDIGSDIENVKYKTKKQNAK